MDMKIANSALRQSGAERFQFETPLRNAASAKHISYYNLLKQIKHTNRLAFWENNKKSWAELTVRYQEMDPAQLLASFKVLDAIIFTFNT